MTTARWATHHQFTGMIEGRDYVVGNAFELKFGYGRHYEVTFLRYGVVALVDCQTTDIVAVQVPGRRGTKLHVSDLCHGTKWGRIHSGAGLVWADRKTWASATSVQSLADLCTSRP